MHSSTLRGSDFKIDYRKRVIDHAAFFKDFQSTDRLGVICPVGLEGLGAISLIMTFVTAFYDRYRERGSEFFAYPDFFTFQRRDPCADYNMCDISPFHKNVHVAEGAQPAAEAIADRGITHLLVHDEESRDPEISRVEAESLRRNVRRCFTFSESGTTDAADLIVECESHLVGDFGLAVIDSVAQEVDALRAQWQEQISFRILKQSFRELDLEAALRRI